MKSLSRTLLIILTSMLTAGQLTAQIEIAEYERKLRVNVDEVDSVEKVEATSSCGEVLVTQSEQTFSGGCLGTLVRTYLFTDECGNNAKAEQYITLLDDTPPVFENNFPDVELTEDKLLPAPSPVATDNSGAPVEIEYSVIREGDQVIRTWIAEDPCGNKARMKQVVDIIQ